MTGPHDATTLLALDAGVRETGWAIFRPGGAVETGAIGTATRRRVDAESRVGQLVMSLDLLVVRWQPANVVHSLPSGIHWPVPALDLLQASLVQWSRNHGLALHAYTAQEVRVAMVGHPNASRQQLAYAVMVRLGLIGQSKTTHEWEALAVGCYHRNRGAGEPDGSG